MQASTGNRITEQQLELLKSFTYFTDEKQIAEVKELLHLYYTHKLDASIEQEEAARNYSSEVYEKWLQTQKKQ